MFLLEAEGNNISLCDIVQSVSTIQYHTVPYHNSVLIFCPVKRVDRDVVLWRAKQSTPNHANNQLRYSTKKYSYSVLAKALFRASQHGFLMDDERRWPWGFVLQLTLQVNPLILWHGGFLQHDQFQSILVVLT